MRADRDGGPHEETQLHQLFSACRKVPTLSPEMGVFAPPSPFCKNVKCQRETEILVEQQPPEGAFVYDHAGRVINQFSEPSTPNPLLPEGVLNPKPQIPIPKPQSPNPNPQTPIPKSQSPHPNPQTPIPKPQTPNPIFNPQTPPPPAVYPPPTRPCGRHPSWQSCTRSDLPPHR